MEGMAGNHSFCELMTQNSNTRTFIFSFSDSMILLLQTSLLHLFLNSYNTVVHSPVFTKDI